MSPNETWRLKLKLISGEVSSLAKLRSDYHPETWQPAWSVATVLKGLLSFMCEDADGKRFDLVWKLLGSVQSMFFSHLYSMWLCRIRCGYILCWIPFDEHLFQISWHLQDVFFQSWIVCFWRHDVGVGELHVKETPTAGAIHPPPPSEVRTFPTIRKSPMVFFGPRVTRIDLASKSIAWNQVPCLWCSQLWMGLGQGALR